MASNVNTPKFSTKINVLTSKFTYSLIGVKLSRNLFYEKVILFSHISFFRYIKSVYHRDNLCRTLHCGVLSPGGCPVPDKV